MNFSNVSQGKITLEERLKNISFLRALYTLFAFELLVSVIWTSFAFAYYHPLGAGIQKYWQIAIVTGILCLILILVAFFVRVVQSLPINIIIYVLFTLCFMHFSSWLALIDPTILVYYALWLLLAVAIGFAIYAWSTNTSTNSIVTIMITVISALIIFVVFLIFTDVVFIGLLLVLLAVIVYGFYLNYDVRKMVTGGIADFSREDPWTGAVKIWIESLFVFCRFIELLGRSCCK